MQGRLNACFAPDGIERRILRKGICLSRFVARIRAGFILTPVQEGMFPSQRRHRRFQRQGVILRNALGGRHRGMFQTVCVISYSIVYPVIDNRRRYILIAHGTANHRWISQISPDGRGIHGIGGPKRHRLPVWLRCRGSVLIEVLNRKHRRAKPEGRADGHILRRHGESPGLPVLPCRLNYKAAAGFNRYSLRFVIMIRGRHNRDGFTFRGPGPVRGYAPMLNRLSGHLVIPFQDDIPVFAQPDNPVLIITEKCAFRVDPSVVFPVVPDQQAIRFLRH